MTSVNTERNNWHLLSACHLANSFRYILFLVFPQDCFKISVSISAFTYEETENQKVYVIFSDSHRQEEAEPRLKPCIVWTYGPCSFHGTTLPDDLIFEIVEFKTFTFICEETEAQKLLCVSLELWLWAFPTFLLLNNLKLISGVEGLKE
jgi:hypothetical protein